MSGLPYPPPLAGYGLGTPKIQVPGTARPAGLVVAASMDVTGSIPAMRCSASGKGTFVEYAHAPADKPAPKRADLSFEQAVLVGVVIWGRRITRSESGHTTKDPAAPRPQEARFAG